MLPTIISFYTKNTIYEQEAAHLIASCKKLDLPFEIDGVDSMGEWEENCRYKPTFILQKLKQLKRPILWSDADAMILKKPKTQKGDIAVCIDKTKMIDDPAHLFSGTIFFNYTPKTLQLIEHWIKECTDSKTVWGDQVSLRDVILKNKAQAQIDFLPGSYWLFYDKVDNETLINEAVILHYQASRIVHDPESSPYLKLIQNEERTSRFFHRLSTLHQFGIHDVSTFR